MAGRKSDGATSRAPSLKFTYSVNKVQSYNSKFKVVVMDIIVRQTTKEEIDEYFDFFSKSVQALFPEYTENTRKFFYTNSRALNKEEILKKIEEGHVVLEALVDDKIAGLLIAGKPFGGVSFCHWLMVDPNFQRKGIGTKLLTYWEEIVKEMGAHNLKLEAIDKNLKFYGDFGFETLGLEKKGSFGTDNYILRKIIQEPKEENYLK